MDNHITLSLLVDNTSGVLSRIAGLFARRAYNIDSLTVSPAAVEGYSRMTIRINGDDNQVEQFINQMMKIVDVKNAEVLPDNASVASELILIKVSTEEPDNHEILAVTSKYHASLVNIGEHSMTFRASGTPEDIDTLVSELSSYGIMEMARTGIAALENGDRCLNNI